MKKAQCHKCRAAMFIEQIGDGPYQCGCAAGSAKVEGVKTAAAQGQGGCLLPFDSSRRDGCTKPNTACRPLPGPETRDRADAARSQPSAFSSSLCRRIRTAIHDALDRNDGNKPQAAEELGISLKTLYNKLNQNSALEKSA